VLLQSSRAPAWIQTRRKEESKALANVPVFSIGLVSLLGVFVCRSFEPFGCRLGAVWVPFGCRLGVVAFLVRFGLRPTVIASNVTDFFFFFANGHGSSGTCSTTKYGD
jgi:hypothetical protein